MKFFGPRYWVGRPVRVSRLFQRGIVRFAHPSSGPSIMEGRDIMRTRHGRGPPGVITKMRWPGQFEVRRRNAERIIGTWSAAVC